MTLMYGPLKKTGDNTIKTRYKLVLHHQPNDICSMTSPFPLRFFRIVCSLNIIAEVKIVSLETKA